MQSLVVIRGYQLLGVSSCCADTCEGHGLQWWLKLWYHINLCWGMHDRLSACVLLVLPRRRQRVFSLHDIWTLSQHGWERIHT